MKNTAPVNKSTPKTKAEKQKLLEKILSDGRWHSGAELVEKTGLTKPQITDWTDMNFVICVTVDMTLFYCIEKIWSPEHPYLGAQAIYHRKCKTCGKMFFTTYNRRNCVTCEPPDIFDLHPFTKDKLPAYSYSKRGRPQKNLVE